MTDSQNLCFSCKRHFSHHPELFALLTGQQQDDLQVMLCAGHESGDCQEDPWIN